jgi:lipid II:glycine glycyltransferase (peptidoglycan interpeptide bridge formation enzyme)
MELELTNDKKIWNDFLLKNNGSFLQSFEWAEFQKQNSKKVWLFQAKENNAVVGQFLIIKEAIPRIKKNFLYIPFGPTIKTDIGIKKQQEIIKNFLEEIKKTAKKENCVFLRIEPYSPISLFGKTASKRIQPQKTLILGLEKPEEEIFKNFHWKTGYNIKLAQRKGIEVEVFNKSNSDIALYSDIFYNLVFKTGKRQDFGLYPKEYYQNLLDIYSDDFKSELFLAKFQGKFIAAAIAVFFGEKAATLHSGMDYQFRHLKAPYLLRWFQIQEAKKRGFKEYDFWGIDEKKWPGLTYFKKNFNGDEFIYPESKDLIFRKVWYFIYNFLRKFK